MDIIKAYEDLYNIIKTILKDNVKPLNTYQDYEFIYGTFTFENIDINELSLDQWIDLTRKVDLGHLSFLLNSKATLKSIYNEADEINKKKLLKSFINISKKLKSVERYTKLFEDISEGVEKNLNNKNIVINMLSNFKKYKDPKCLAYIIDEYTMNKDFREFIINQVKSKTKTITEKIEKTKIFTEDDKEFIYENINSEKIVDFFNGENYYDISLDGFDFIMKINLIGEIHITRELHLLISNYIINLFNKSKFLIELTKIMDERYKLHEKDKDNYIIRDSVTKIVHIKTFDKKKKLNVDEGFKGLFENEDKKIIYRSKNLKVKLVHIILKVIEIVQLSFNSNNFEGFNKEEEIRKIFNKEFDKSLIENLNFTKIIDLILTNDIETVVEKENFKLFIHKIFDRLICTKTNKNLLDMILDKVDDSFEFFKENIIKEEIIEIIKKIGSYLDGNINLESIKKALNKKIKYKTMS